MVMKVLILNFGNPAALCDRFGPLLGTKLQSSLAIENKITVHGSIEDPLYTIGHYNTVNDMVKLMDWDLVIATDAAAGPHYYKDKLLVSEGGVHPGRGTPNKNDTDFIGDYGIIYCVGEDPLNSYHCETALEYATTLAIMEIEKLIARKSLEIGIKEYS